jgi:hypothetical protein
VYLREAYKLNLAEHLLEVPLDSLTGEALWEASEKQLPRWKTIRGLTRQVSDAYQDVASLVAADREIARVHLDALWWGQRITSGK